MAQKVSIQLVSDLSGGEADETVGFALDGTTYELDLTSKEADKFRGYFQDYISVARKVSGGRGKKSSAPKSTEDLAAIREWAKSQGMEVSERGRVAQSIKDAYYAATT